MRTYKSIKTRDEAIKELRQARRKATQDRITIDDLVATVRHRETTIEVLRCDRRKQDDLLNERAEIIRGLQEKLDRMTESRDNVFREKCALEKELGVHTGHMVEVAQARDDWKQRAVMRKAQVEQLEVEAKRLRAIMGELRSLIVDQMRDRGSS